MENTYSTFTDRFTKGLSIILKCEEYFGIPMKLQNLPLLEGLKLAVKDDELPPSPASSSLDHQRHRGIAVFVPAIAACLVLIGCGIGIIRHRFDCKNSPQPP